MSAPHYVPPKVIERLDNPEPAVRFSDSAHVFGRREHLGESRLTQEAIDDARAVEADAERFAGVKAAAFLVFSCIGAVVLFGLACAAVFSTN